MLALLRFQTSTPKAAPPLPAGLPACLESEGHWRVARWARDAYFYDLTRVNREIALRPVPGATPGSLAELWIERLTPECPVFTAGLRPGDRVLEVNGAPVSTMSRALNLLLEIRTSPSVSVAFEREGRVSRLRFDVE